jgi:hypothetical protein
MSGTNARAITNQRPISEKQEDFLFKLIDAAQRAGDGQKALDTLTHHGGKIITDRSGARHIKGLTGGHGTGSLAIGDLKDRNYRPATGGGPGVAPTRRTNGTVDTTTGPTPAGGHHGTRDRAATSPAGDRFRAAAAPRFTPTAEQDTIVELFKTGDSLKVFAGAGAGKTSTLKLCAEATPTRRGLFTAFNSSIVKAADRSFPKRLVECRTMHSLAYRATPQPFIDRMKRSRRVHPDKIASNLGIRSIVVTVPQPDGTTKRRVLQAGYLASLVMVAIGRFCQSADETPSKKHFGRQEGLDADGVWDNHNAIAGALERHLAPVWADLCKTDGWGPYKHETYLKQWALTHPVIPHDYLLVDEGQDLNGVMLSIVEDQLKAGKQVVVVGDTFQSINEWMGSINALEKLPIVNEAQLTKSFRFGPKIAALANEILASLGTDFRITGNDDVPSTVGAANVPVRCTLSRSNAVAVEGYMDDRSKGGRPHLVGQTDDIIWFCQFARVLQITEERESCASRLTLPGLTSATKAEIEATLTAIDAEWDENDLDGVGPHPELACFSAWAEVRLFVSEHEDGKEIKLMVKLVDDFGAMDIVGALKDMTDEMRCTHVFATAHKMKGREFDTVELAADFLDDIDKCDDAEKKLLYVASTRAKRHLDPTQAACLDGMYVEAVAA